MIGPGRNKIFKKKNNETFWSLATLEEAVHLFIVSAVISHHRFIWSPLNTYMHKCRDLDKGFQYKILY